MKKDYKSTFVIIAAFAAVICFCILDFHFPTNKQPENTEKNNNSSAEVETTKDDTKNSNENSESTSNSSSKATSIPESDPTVIGYVNRDFLPGDYDDQNEAFNNSYNEAYEYCQEMKEKGYNMVIVQVYDGNNFVGYGCRDNKNYDYSSDEQYPSRAEPLGDYYSGGGSSDNG